MRSHRFSYRTSFGEKTVNLDIPESFDLDIIGPGEKKGKTDIFQGIKLDISRQDRVFFIVNDAKRPFIAPRILETITPRVINNQNFYFMIATGSHYPPTKKELGDIFGKAIYSNIKNRVLVHDARRSETVYMGRSSRGTDIYINRAVLDFDWIVTIGSIEPHYFAGYTGGRKSLVPGICGFKTIEQNHSLAREEGSRILKLEGNPLHQDLMECTRIVLNNLRTRRNPRIVAINAVTAGEKIYHVRAGELLTSLDPLIDRVNALYLRKVADRKDLLIAIAGFPLNKDLYQGLKAFENGKSVLNDGGIFILVAECDQGLGPLHFDTLLQDYRDEREFLAKVKKKFSLSSHKLINLLRFLAKNNQIYLVSGLAREKINPAFFRDFKNLQLAFDEAVMDLAKKGIKYPKILAINDAANIVSQV